MSNRYLDKIAGVKDYLVRGGSKLVKEVETNAYRHISSTASHTTEKIRQRLDPKGMKAYSTMTKSTMGRSAQAIKDNEAAHKIKLGAGVVGGATAGAALKSGKND